LFEKNGSRKMGESRRHFLGSDNLPVADRVSHQIRLQFCGWAFRVPDLESQTRNEFFVLWK
jgi:hypothetical protein